MSNKKKLTALLLGIVMFLCSFVPVFAESDFDPDGMTVIGASGSSSYTRKVSTSIGIYTKNGTVPGVQKYEGTYGGVKYNVLEVDAAGTDGTIIQVDYAGNTPQYLNNFYDHDLTANDEYCWVGSINAGFFTASTSSNMYGYPTGAVKRNGVEQTYTSTGTSNSPWGTSPSYGSGFVTALTNKDDDFKLGYIGWKDGVFYKKAGDPSPNSWEYGDYSTYSDAVSGAYTLIVDGDSTIHWGKGDYQGTDFWNYAGTCVTLFGQKPNGNYLLVTTESALNAQSQVALMTSLGCNNAIRFDGGGSTQMAFDKGLIVDHFYLHMEDKQIAQGNDFPIDDLEFDLYDENNGYHYAAANDIPQLELQYFDANNNLIDDFKSLPIGNYYVKAKMNGLEQILPVEIVSATHNVTFDEGHDDLKQVIEVNHKEKVVMPEEPKWTGHRFIGWMLNDETYDFEKLVKEDITLTAKWETLAITGYDISCSKTEYAYGEELDPSTIIITMQYEDGTSRVLDSDEYSIEFRDEELIGSCVADIKLVETDGVIGDITIEYGEPLLDEIIITQLKNIMTGDKVDASYFEIKGKLENGNLIDINFDDCTIEGLDTSKEGDITIKFIKDEVEGSLNVHVYRYYPTINKTIDHIKIEDVYRIDEWVNEISLVFDDGTSEITNCFSMLGYNWKAGKQSLTIEFNYYDDDMELHTYSQDFDIFIKDYENVYATKEKIDYFVGDTLDLDDFKVFKDKIDYSIPTSIQENTEDYTEISANELIIDDSDVNINAPGTYPIHLTYKMNSDPEVIEVIDDIEVNYIERLTLPEHEQKIVSLSINDDLRFYKDEIVDTRNFAVLATLEDGTQVILDNNDVVITDFDLSYIGSRHMTISYEYQINNVRYFVQGYPVYYVSDFESLSLNSISFKVKKGDDFDFEEIKAYKQLGELRVEISRDELRFDPSFIDTNIKGSHVVDVYFSDDITGQEYKVDSALVNVYDETVNDQKGSITLYKYESKDGKYINGNFYQQDVTGIVGDPIEGVGFKYLKIGDLYQTQTQVDSTVALYYILDSSFLDEIHSYGIELEANVIDGVDCYTTEDINVALRKMHTTEANYGENIDGTAVPNEKMNKFIDNNGVAMPDTDANGKTIASDLEQGLYIVGEVKQPSIAQDGVIKTQSRPSSPFLMPIPVTNVAEINGATPGTEWQYDLVAYPKSEMMVIRKDIIANGNDLDDGSTNNGLVQHTDKNVGDYVKFLLTADVPALQPQISGTANSNRKYIINDSMTDGLTIDSFDSDNFAVKLGTGVYNSTVLSELEYDVDYGIEPTIDGFKLVISEIGLAKFNALTEDSKLYVTYEARLNNEAANPKGNIKTESNSYSLTYGTAVTKDQTFISNDDISVHNYEVNIKKTFTSDIDDMSVVSFTIANEDDEIIEFVKDEDGNYHKYDGKESNELVSEIHTDENGKLCIRGLDDGKYVIKEISTVSGYNLLRDPIVLNIVVDNPENGQITSAFIENNGRRVTITDKLENGLVNFEIRNNDVIEILPTGGQGWSNVGVYIGIALIAAGIIVIIVKKKNGKK